MKLTRGIGILIKQRKKANTDILKVVYHPHFGSHILYGFQPWGQRNVETQTKMTCALKKYLFLGHLMRQLKISTNSAKYLGLET